MVVRAARAEVLWRRPSAGPGARSRSADPRSQLEPLAQVRAAQPASKRERGGSACLEARPTPSSGDACPAERSAPRPHVRPASGPEWRSLSPRHLQGPPHPAAAPSAAPRRLLRPCSHSRSPSSVSPHWEDLPESDGEVAFGTADSEAIDSLERPAEAWEPEAGGPTDREDAYEFCSDSDLAELLRIETALKSKEAELRDIEVRKTALVERLETSEEAVGESRKIIAQLQAGLAHTEAEVEAQAEALGAHNTPRRRETSKVAPKQLPQSSTSADLNKLVGAWSRAFPRGSPPADAHPTEAHVQARLAMGLGLGGDPGSST